MSQIKNIEGMTMPQLINEVNQGGKFVIFTYTISILVMTFRRPTDIYYIAPGESALKHQWGYTILSLILGWWGIPWGLIYTPAALFSNLSGGKDITYEVMQQLMGNNKPM